MQFTEEIIIPANTAKEDDNYSTINLSYGILHLTTFDFPAGCAGLVHAACYFGSSPAIPSTEGMSISADGRAVHCYDFIKVYRGKSILKIKTWNLDDTYPHTIKVHCQIMKEKYLLPSEGIISAFNSLIGRFRR